MAERAAPDWNVALKLYLVLCALAYVAIAPPAEAAEKPGIKFFGEVNFNFRNSTFEEYKINVAFPPSWWEEGDEGVYLRTVDPGSHYEMSDVELGFDVTFSDKWSGRVLIHVVDLYNRNPTSIDKDVFVREFWIRYGTEEQRYRPLKPWGGYVSVGKSDRFASQTVRHLESYGLWGTAVNRFEIPQVQLGLNLGGNFYVRAPWRADQIGSPKPVD